MFQSRNREAYLFKIWFSLSSTTTVSPCFNLVIEYLIFSSIPDDNTTTPDIDTFQSRNRVSYLFKDTLTFTSGAGTQTFQSRNRVSYLFKGVYVFLEKVEISKFQSRNRVSYLFKRLGLPPRKVIPPCFNLGIEYLIFSSILDYIPHQEVSSVSIS